MSTARWIMNWLPFSKLLFVVAFCAPFATEAQGNSAACSPSNTDITIDAQVPGEISTPVFPDNSSGISCTWKIQAPENFQLEITIKDLSFNGDDDYLIVRDGPDTNNPRIGNYGQCTTGSLTLFSSGTSLFLEAIIAQFSVNDKLKIAYKPIEPDDLECTEQPSFCGVNDELSEPSGVITSPNFPNNYGEGESCLWTIVAPPGHRIQFEIHFFGIEDHRYSNRPGSCMDDAISINEVVGNSTRGVKTLCGCSGVFSFISFGRRMFLKFTSFKKNYWPGFYATYKRLTPEECPAGKTDCTLKKTAPIGFNAQGQVCSLPSPGIIGKSEGEDGGNITVDSKAKREDGGNITVDSEAQIEVVCRPDYIEVTLQLSDYPGLVVNDSVLHLEDKACVVSYKDDNMVKFTFGLEACKTEIEDDGNKIYYKNKVYLKAGQPANDEDITREHSEIIPFQCGYDKRATISKVSYGPRMAKLITDADGFGNFTYYMDMYEDATNNETVTEFPKEVGLGQKMYFGFRVESGDSELVVFPDVCKATASSGFDSIPDHLIIENACSRDSTLEFQYDKTSKQFFSVKGFRFSERHSDVYIHCKLTVCRTDDTGSRCDKGCEASKRRRRLIEEEMSAELYIGPLRAKFTSDRAGEEHDYVKSESPNSLVLIVAVLVGVLATVAIGLIIAVVVFSRRRNASTSGALLVVSEEM